MALQGTPVRGRTEPARPELVSVHGIGAGGEGVGTLKDGRIVFLPRTAPGDRVRVRLLDEKDRWSRGEVLDVVEEGPGRRPPPCPLFARCDGCSLQHLEYGEQLRWKSRLVRDALQRIGGLDVEDPLVEPSMEELQYRNRVTFTLRRLPGGRVVAGFRERTRRGRVLDVGSECLLPERGLSRVWGQIREAWGPTASHLPPGRELRLTLRSGTTGVGLLCRGGKGMGDPAALLSRVPGVSSVWREGKDGSVHPAAGEEAIRVTWMGRDLEIPGGGFLQVNTGGGEALHRYVLNEAGEVEGQRILDTYCGIGILGQALADRGATVVGIEADPTGVAVARAYAGPRFQVIEGRVEDALAELLPADQVILNPPRTGLQKSLTEVLKRKDVSRLIYVSCDPATLARDLARLGPGYRLRRLQAFDLFPQTAHVETVATLTGKGG